MIHKTEEFTGSFEDLFNIFMEDKFWMGSWFDHVNGYTSLYYII
jgi:hypothetical protein